MESAHDQRRGTGEARHRLKAFCAVSDALFRAPRLVALGLVLLAVSEIALHPAVVRIVISKSLRRLTAYDAAGRVVREFPIGLGRNELGHKQREGDGRTPEGDYAVCFKNPASRFHLSLGLNYPNAADAESGRASGAIDDQEYRRIVDAERSNRVPPWGTALGGEIFIHGGLAEHGATAGCVAVTNEAIEQLFPLVGIGTRVEIRR